MGWQTFYWRWLRTAFGGVLDRTALVAFGVFAAAEVARRFFAAAVPVVSDWYWSIPFWALVAVIAWRLVRAPLEIWREDQATITGLGAAADSDAKRKAIRMEFAQLIHDGETIMTRCRDPEDATVQDDANAWGDRAEAKIIELLDESYIPRFRSSTGTPSNVIVGPGSKENGGYWSGVRNRVFRLQEFTREVSAPGVHHPQVL